MNRYYKTNKNPFFFLFPTDDDVITHERELVLTPSAGSLGIVSSPKRREGRRIYVDTLVGHCLNNTNRETDDRSRFSEAKRIFFKKCCDKKERKIYVLIIIHGLCITAEL